MWIVPDPLSKDRGIKKMEIIKYAATPTCISLLSIASIPMDIYNTPIHKLERMHFLLHC
jgi:hypothetical protein